MTDLEDENKLLREKVASLQAAQTAAQAPQALAITAGTQAADTATHTQVAKRKRVSKENASGKANQSKAAKTPQTGVIWLWKDSAWHMTQNTAQSAQLCISPKHSYMHNFSSKCGLHQAVLLVSS